MKERIKRHIKLSRILIPVSTEKYIYYKRKGHTEIAEKTYLYIYLFGLLTVKLRKQ